MDKPEANPDRIKEQLTAYELVPEEWGGETIICPISAKTGMGIDELLEMVSLTAELRELKANPSRTARSLRPSWIRAGARWPLCWCRTAPSIRAM
jgi:translation initiation factor IF-2